MITVTFAGSLAASMDEANVLLPAVLLIAEALPGAASS
jgi:hypothetical protein